MTTWIDVFHAVWPHALAASTIGVLAIVFRKSINRLLTPRCQHFRYKINMRDEWEEIAGKNLLFRIETCSSCGDVLKKYEVGHILEKYYAIKFGNTFDRIRKHPND